MKSYRLTIGELQRDLPVLRISENLSIACFLLPGDVPLIRASATLLAQKLPPVDLLVTAESKGVPLVHEMSALLGLDRYVIIRKSEKLYMSDTLTCKVKSITTEKEQTLYLNGSDARLIADKRVAVIDDVISTGGTLEAIGDLMEQANARVEVTGAVLAEGDAAERKDIVFLDKLPLFFD